MPKCIYNPHNSRFGEFDGPCRDAAESIGLAPGRAWLWPRLAVAALGPGRADELVEPGGRLLADRRLDGRRPSQQLPARTERHSRPAPEIEGVLLPGDQPVLEPELGADVVVDHAAGLGELVLRLPRRVAGGVVDGAHLAGQLQPLAASGQPRPHLPRPVALQR